MIDPAVAAAKPKDAGVPSPNGSQSNEPTEPLSSQFKRHGFNLPRMKTTGDEASPTARSSAMMAMHTTQ
jgi:hypothetical protein